MIVILGKHLFEMILIRFHCITVIRAAINQLSYDEEFIRVPGKHPCNFFEHATCVATIINHYDRNEADFKEPNSKNSYDM